MTACGNLLECYNKAVETLEKGFELTGDERIEAALAALRSENEETSETEAAVEETERNINAGSRYSVRCI